MKNSFFPIQRNSTLIDEYILSTFSDDWDYLTSLKLKNNQVKPVSLDQILENSHDIAQGVNRVETKFDSLFFNLFDNLVIKHFIDGGILLMFYTEVKNSNKVFTFYESIKRSLGGGFTYGKKFASFDITHKVVELAKGKHQNDSDEILQTWNTEKFSYTLNFRLLPLRRLLFNVNFKPRKEFDRSVRNRGTIKSLLKHQINEVLMQQPLKIEPRYEQEQIIFTNYLFGLDPPEFGIFDQIEIKLNGESKQISEKIDSNVTYYSRYEISTENVIKLVDLIVKIYGKDDYADAELLPYEVDLIENSEFWTGRSWLINQHHALQNLDNPLEYTIYQLSIRADPNDKGVNLNITGFNTLVEYDDFVIYKSNG